MTQTIQPDSATGAPRPARPNLFASPGEAGGNTDQRISVLASLDVRPPAAPRRSRRPIWIALAGLFGVCMLSGGIWYAMSAPAGKEQGTPPLAARPVVAPTAEASAPEPVHASAAPASIERIAVEQSAPASTSELPVAAQSSPEAEPPVVAAASAPAARPAPAPELAIAADKPEEHKSLLHSLAAPQKPAQKTVAGKPKAKQKDSLDTDVILLEALVSHSKKNRAESAQNGEVTP